MNGFLHMYIKMNANIILFAIRLVIGGILIITLKGVSSNYKRNIVIIYYGAIVGSILSCLLSSTAFSILTGGSIGILLSLCAIKSCKGDKLIYFILFFVTTYEILEFVFNILNLNFSEILKTYNDIYVDYTTMYVKLFSSIFLSMICCLIYKKVSENKVGNFLDKVIIFC